MLRTVPRPAYATNKNGPYGPLRCDAKQKAPYGASCLQSRCSKNRRHPSRKAARGGRRLLTLPELGHAKPGANQQHGRYEDEPGLGSDREPILLKGAAMLVFLAAAAG